jgi:hypothetical protein
MFVKGQVEDPAPAVTQELEGGDLTPYRFTLPTARP